MLLFDALNACALCFSPFITFDNVRSSLTKRQDRFSVILALYDSVFAVLIYIPEFFFAAFKQIIDICCLLFVSRLVQYSKYCKYLELYYTPAKVT